MFNKKTKPGLVGVEVRSDGIAVATSLKINAESGPAIVSQDFYACKAAQRKDVLAEIVETHALKGMSCNLVLSSDQYQILQIEKPPVSDGELADAVRWKVKDMIDYPLDDAVTDIFDFPEDATRGRGSLVNVVCARKILIQEYIRLIDDVGLELLSIDVAELVLRNVSMRYDASGNGLALLFLRHGFGMMLISKGDTMYFSRRFDFSLDALKDPASQESAVQQLALEVQRSLDYYESQMGQIPPKELLLMGPDSSFPLVNMLDQNLALSVNNLDVSALFNTGDENAVVSDGLIQSFAAIGAALREKAN